MALSSTLLTAIARLTKNAIATPKMINDNKNIFFNSTSPF